MSTPTRYALNLRFDKMPYLDPLFTFERASAATRINPQTGMLETVAANVPRIEKDGLLIEGASTNLVSKSVFEGAAGDQPLWFNSAACSMLLSEDLPRFCGALVAKHKRTTSDTSVGYCDPYGAAGPHVFSVDLWLPSGQDVSGLHISAEWAASDVSVLTPVNLNLRDAWQRVSVRFTRANSADLSIVIIRCVGTGFFYSRAWQVELGHIVTSYIPTFGDAVTRAAELCHLDGIPSAAWFNRERGTLVIDAAGVCIPGQNTAAAHITAATGSIWDNSINIENNNAGTWDFSVSANTAQLTRVSMLPTTQPLKMAASWESGAWSAFANGAKIEVPDTAPVPPVDQLWLGSWRGWNNGGSFRIRSLQILPHTVSEGVLRAMSELV